MQAILVIENINFMLKQEKTKDSIVKLSPARVKGQGHQS